MRDAMELAFYKFAAGGTLPAKWFEPDLPDLPQRRAKTGRLTLEVVSHCWNYAHFLVYQLSSLVLNPPHSLDVTMTVFYAPEDRKTADLLAFFSTQTAPNVTWNWQPLDKPELFRRGIGRNRAALASNADWVWFTDCDLMFRDGCLEQLAEALQGRQDALLFPREERVTELLADDNPLLQEGGAAPQVLDIDTTVFTSNTPGRATGPLQIAHGDVCRAVGYCRHIRIYQTPVTQFAKCHEDRAFRWLLQSQGAPIDVPGVYRIRHIQKGRYGEIKGWAKFRRRIRQLTDKY